MLRRRAAPDGLQVLGDQAGGAVGVERAGDMRRDVCDEANLPAADRNRLWERQFLNPFAFEGY